MAQGPQASWSFDKKNDPASPAPSATTSDRKGPASTLSVREYHALQQRRRALSSESPSGDNMARRAADDLFEGLEEGEALDYGSDTSMPQREDSPAPSPTRSPEHGQRRQAPAPLAYAQVLTALRASSGLGTPQIANDLDEAQERQLGEPMPVRSQRPEARPLLSSRREYQFTPLDPAERVKQYGSGPLSSWRIGPAANSSDQVAARTALREKHLTVQETTPQEYGTRLSDQARGASVPAMRTIPVVLYPGELLHEDDAQFTDWVHRARRLSSLEALRASFDEADVRLERRLRFDFAKIKTRRRIVASQSLQSLGLGSYALTSAAGPHQGGSVAAAAQDQRLSSAYDPSAPLPSGGKREAIDYAVAGSRSSLDHGDQKRPRRLGSLAGGVPQTPTSSLSGGTRATSPDTGYERRIDDALECSPRGSEGSPARRAKPEVAVPPPVEQPVLPQELEQVQGSLSKLRYQVERHQWMLGQAEQDYDRAANEIRELQERLAWVEAPLSATQRLDRLEQGSAHLEQGLARLGGPVDLLIQLRQHGVAQPLQAPAPGNPLGPGPGTA